MPPTEERPADPVPFAHVLLQPMETYEYVQIPPVNAEAFLSGMAINRPPNPNYTEHEHRVEVPARHTIISRGSQRIHDYDSVPGEELLSRFDRVITVTRGIASTKIRIDMGFKMHLPGSDTQLELFETSATVDIPVNLLPISEEQRLGIVAIDNSSSSSSSSKKGTTKKRDAVADKAAAERQKALASLASGSKRKMEKATAAAAGSKKVVKKAAVAAVSTRRGKQGEMTLKGSVDRPRVVRNSMFVTDDESDSDTEK